MKKIKANRKMIIGVIIGIIISVTTSYVLAATLINSQDVVYDDKTSGLGVNNVQNAIDKTCSNIDTRLSGIEDNLYTVTPFYHAAGAENRFTAKSTWFYTGKSITFPANSYCNIDVIAVYLQTAPVSVAVSSSSTSLIPSTTINSANVTDVVVSPRTHVTFFTEAVVTYYIWAKYSSNTGTNDITYTGFCITEHK